MADRQKISVSHVGSLPPVEGVLDTGDPAQRASHDQLIQNNVCKMVDKQVELGLDIINDGEVGRRSFIGYIGARLSGFELETESRPSVWRRSRDGLAFPGYYSNYGGAPTRKMRCVGPVKYTGQENIAADIRRLTTATAGKGVEGVFLTSPSPGAVQNFWRANEFYKSDEEYLYALADALREEYRAVIDAGFFLQIDDPTTCTYWMSHPEVSLDQYLKRTARCIEALNHALRGLPPERIRHHTCYGINVGPRVHDMEMKHILHLILNIDVGIYSFEAANPRHEHEVELWDHTKLPAGKKLMPGLITNSSVLVEHPDLVCQRLVRFAQRVGPENLLAGADCGYSSSGHPDDLPAEVVWAKFQSLVEGTRKANELLWRS